MARYNKLALVEDLSLQEVFTEASKKQVTELVEDIFQIIADKVVAGDEVVIPGFGKFEKYQRTNGVYKPKFTAYKQFKAVVNG